MHADDRLNLEYYSKHHGDWGNDYEVVQRVNDFLIANKSIIEEATIPERSYQLYGDEKWLGEKGGLKILERLGVINILRLRIESDPCMFGINKNFRGFKNYKHLIVENKSIYYKVLEILNETAFSTVIYGSGWKVVASMRSFNQQFPFEDKIHETYYFGDLDREGIKIWHTLAKGVTLKLADGLYHGLFAQEMSDGKGNQLKDEIS